LPGAGGPKALVDLRRGLDGPSPFREHASPQEKHRKASGFAQTKARVLYEREKKNRSKVEERSGNVYENKGPALSGPGRSGNVTENKGSYGLNAGILLKRKRLDTEILNCEL
jgi:hypothetical protein